MAFENESVGKEDDEPIEVKYSSGGKSQLGWFMSCESKEGGPHVDDAAVLKVVREEASELERQQVLRLVATYRSWHETFMKFERRKRNASD